jgi:hypothetical protein
MLKCLSSLVLLSLALAAPDLSADAFPDPAPPKFTELDPKEAPAPQPFDRLTFHAPPKALNAEAKTSDWHRLLGPHDDATSPETHLLHDLPKDGPPKVWEVKKAEGYTSPAIEGNYLVFFMVRVACHDGEMLVQSRVVVPRARGAGFGC